MTHDFATGATFNAGSTASTSPYRGPTSQQMSLGGHTQTVPCLNCCVSLCNSTSLSVLWKIGCAHLLKLECGRNRIQTQGCVLPCRPVPFSMKQGVGQGVSARPWDILGEGNPAQESSVWAAMRTIDARHRTTRLGA